MSVNVHNPDQYMASLRTIIALGRKRLGLLVGAGAPAGMAKADGTYMLGKVGKDLTIEQGYAAARQTAIGVLSTLKAELGDLNKIKRVVKVNGWVNCTPEFTDQPKVVNGFSDLMVAVFGEKGKHARAAMGVNALPNGMAIEVEMVVELE